MQEGQNPTPGADGADARSRALRTLAQAAAVTVVVGASTAVYHLSSAGDGDALTLTTIATAALTGAGTALAAWVQRLLEVRSGRN